MRNLCAATNGKQILSHGTTKGSRYFGTLPCGACIHLSSPAWLKVPPPAKENQNSKDSSAAPLRRGQGAQSKKELADCRAQDCPGKLNCKSRTCRRNEAQNGRPSPKQAWILTRPPRIQCSIRNVSWVIQLQHEVSHV